MRHALIALSLVWIVACGSNGGGGDDGVDASTDPLAGLTSLRVEPMDQTLVIAQGVAATSAYTAIGTFEDGRIEERDVGLGLRTLGAAEVRLGLEEGDEVVLDMRLPLGQRVRARVVEPDLHGASAAAGAGNGAAQLTNMMGR